ncbi:MAG: hypothetical protein AB7O26_16975, partial [Planctomycetaceae bacterium]
MRRQRLANAQSGATAHCSACRRFAAIAFCTSALWLGPANGHGQFSQRVRAAEPTEGVTTPETDLHASEAKNKGEPIDDI